MGKTQELNTTTDIVRGILIRCPDTRNSDDLLYLRVCEHYNALCVNHSFKEIMTHRKDYGYPQFETVRRSRQKLQAEYPELSAKGSVKEIRQQYEEEYRKYAKRGKG